MKNLSESVALATGVTPPEDRLWKKRFKEEVASRAAQVERLEFSIEALSSTVKTSNAMAQSAQQQVAVLQKELSATRHALIETQKKLGLPEPDGNDEKDSEEEEVKGE